MDRIFITKGEKVIFNDKVCIIIRIVNINTVSIEEVNSHIIHTVSPQSLSPFIQNNKHSTIIHGLSEKDWDKAQKRFEIIQPILKNKGSLSVVKRVAVKENISIPTLYRWVKLYNESGLVSSLSGEKKLGGAGKSRLTEAQDKIINDKIHSEYLTNAKKSIVKTIREIQLICNEIGITPPHANTIRNRIKNISEEEKVKKRLGVQEARYKFEPLKGNFPGADFPLSVVQIDHTLLDIILVDEHYRKPYKRPWITLAMDVYSRVVLGFYLSFDPPGVIGTGMCIANSILPKDIWLNRIGVNAEWPCWGVMDTIHVDNAKEFRGKSLKMACQNYGINLQFRPVGAPHWGGHIERLLGTFSKEIHNLPGTTFSSEVDRKNYESEKNASFSITEIEKWLTTYITKIYHERKHSSLGISPLQKFKEGIMGTDQHPGRGIPSRIFSERKVRLDFMPYIERSIQEYGVVIDHIYYYDDVLRPYIHSIDKNKRKKQYIFKRDPRDISIIYFYDDLMDEYFDIPYRNTSLPPLSIWEYRDVIKNLKNNNLNLNEENIFEAYRELNDIEKNAILETKRKKRKKEENVNSERTINIDNPEVTNQEESIKNITPFDEIDYEPFT